MPQNMRGSEPADTHPHVMVRIAQWIADYWITITMIVVPIVVSAAGILLSDEAAKALGLSDDNSELVQRWAFGVWVVFSVLHVAFSVCHIRSQHRLSVVQAELQEVTSTRDLVISNARSLCDGYLQDLARGPLKFGTMSENSERITLYVHDSEKHFRPIGRFSFNQKYISTGRASYPDDQGCIGQAWQHGICFEILPDPVADERKWQEACHQHRIPLGVSKGLRMKSTLLYACTVQNAAHPRPVAVLVVESTDKDRYTKEQLDELIADDIRQYIARLVVTLRPWLGDADEARKRGF